MCGESCALSPANGQPPADALGIQHGRNRRHDKIAEDEEHARNSHRRGDHEPERRVEQEVPESHVPAAALSLRLVLRDEEEALAEDGVIAGWTEALQLMPVGSKFKLFLPQNLAYGANAAGDVIKPYSTLIFEVELLEIVQ